MPASSSATPGGQALAYGGDRIGDHISSASSRLQTIQ
jgi:hypothetical protein